MLLFERQPAPDHDAGTGARLLFIFVCLEGILGPRFWLLSALHLPVPPAGVRILVQWGLAWSAIRWVARLPLSGIGLRPWRSWSATEKSYFIQVLVLANTVLATIFAGRLREDLSRSSGPWAVGAALLTNFGWGFYQEVMYRGILQTELVRRWGSAAGVLIANGLFTFGPLHFYHFRSGPAALPMFAAIFAIGLFFGVLFRRSGNLWMAAVFHGIGNAYILGISG